MDVVNCPPKKLLEGRYELMAQRGKMIEGVVWDSNSGLPHLI